MIFIMRVLAILGVIVGGAMILHGIMMLNGESMLKGRLGFKNQFHGSIKWTMSLAYIIIGISLLIQNITGLLVPYYFTTTDYGSIKDLSGVIMIIGFIFIAISFIIYLFR